MYHEKYQSIDLHRSAGGDGAGTDPTNATSCFAISGCTISSVNSNTIIRWSSVTGKTYAVERATNLLAGVGAFSATATYIPATPPDNVWTDSPYLAFAR